MNGQMPSRLRQIAPTNSGVRVKSKPTSSLLAAKERRELIEIQGLIFALLAFFRGQTALGF